MAKILMKVDKEIFEAIWEKAKKTKPDITQRAIRHRYHRIREEFKKSISPRMAANILAARMGIDVFRILEDKNELRELRDLLGAHPPRIIRESKPEKQKEDRGITISKRILDTFGLPQSLAKEADRMADVYPDMYVFENLIRYVVRRTLEKKYDKNWWKQPNIVSNEIKRNVQKRKKTERKNRWHTNRGSHEIFYTNFSDLNRMIETNPHEFREIFADSEIQSHMRQLEHSRNIIAHNNPLPPKEVNRIKMYLDDLKRQLKLYSDNHKE